VNALAAAERDSGASLLGVPATEVYEPESVAAAAELLASSKARGLHLGFLGGGTALGLGNPPRPLDAVLGTRRLDRVVEYAHEDQVMVVEAGLTLARLQTLARKNGQWLGVDAPFAERATLGGLVAVGGFGPRRARYGALKDLLLGVTLVRADGAIAHGGGKVVKNVAGFDLPKIVAGSLGTLGLVAQLTVRLHPLPEASTTLVSADLEAAQVVQASLALRKAQLEPSSAVAVRTEDGRFELGVRLEGFGRGVERDAARVAELSDVGGSARIGWRRLDEVSALAFWRRADLPRVQGDLRLRLTALPTRLPEVQALARPLFAALEKPSFVWYATLGIGFLAGNLATSGAASAEATLAAVDSARAASVSGQGALVIERAPVEFYPRLDAWGPLPSSIAVMRALKQRFDPESRLNPGRFIGGI
jgi:glycolate oxidase FAD binding subunit